MITTKGKELLVQYLAGNIERWADSIEVGVGETAAALTDTSLEFPFKRFEVDHVDYDEVNSKVIVRATIPQDEAIGIYEVGVFTSQINADADIGDRLLMNYLSGSTVYTVSNAAISTTNARLGGEGHLMSAPAAGSAFVRGFLAGTDLAEYKSVDEFNLAYHYTSTGGTPTVTVRLETTAADYYQHTFTPSAGYNIETFTKGSMASTGTPSWNLIDSIYVATDDQSDILLDGAMIEEVEVDENEGMVAREVLVTPRLKPEGVEAEMTFEVGLTF